ncbi:hypothetical protein BGZ63DRAFT_408582 [Mariannaea sp. PMI_226]|nr:hypothetical protein BGZ63DRAFT_408582 [Mariannaea sp. PMI_226]
MPRWNRFDGLFGPDNRNGGNSSRHAWLHEEERALLPHYRNQNIDSAVPPIEVTKVCLRLRHLIRECIPCELEEAQITRSHSTIITKQVVQAAKEAGGTEFRGCVVYALLVNLQWFKREAMIELWDATLHAVRATACAVIAKQIIESEEDMEYLLHTILLRRYSVLVDNEPTTPVNVIEKAVDLHAVRVIGSSGYQKCIAYLWRGWLVQDEDDPSVFVDYKDRDNCNFIVHMDPNRMRAPRNQNAAQVLLSFVYLGLYTAAINSVNPSGELDGAEVALYVFTFAYVADELVKLYKAGYHILGFWNAYNGTLYAFLTISLVFRLVGLSYTRNPELHHKYTLISYNMLSFVAPMFWGRLLLYLDSFRFFGAMLVVLKVMMKESVIFFALLIILIIGFLQAFVGLDLADDNVAGDVHFMAEAMLRALMGSPEFGSIEGFGYPWGQILYYCFSFVVMIILLNILIALYNSAYSDIYENADDEYLALFAQKTMQFIRAPDENVYIAPFNLIEIVISGLFEWWMNKKAYEFINDCVMATLYSPLLLISAFFETRTAHSIRRNRARGEEDDDQTYAWEQLNNQIDFESEGWTKTCEAAKPNVEDEPAVVEVRKLRAEVDSLKAMLHDISKAIVLQAEQVEQTVKSKPEPPKLVPEETETTLQAEVGESPTIDTEENPKAAEEETPEQEVPETSQETEASDVPETPVTEEPDSALDTPEGAEAQDASGSGGKKKRKNKKKNKGGAGSGGGPSGA